MHLSIPFRFRAHSYIQVDRTFFLLTHEAVIWKRFLERMRTPIPPLRPTFRYSFQVTDFEAEQLVTRAISLEDNWRLDCPQAKVRRVVDAHHRVLDMCLLPGGKFLVASDASAQAWLREQARKLTAPFRAR